MSEMITEMLKNNFPQRKVRRDLDISSTTVLIIKRFKESRKTDGTASTTIIYQKVTQLHGLRTLLANL